MNLIKTAITTVLLLINISAMAKDKNLDTSHLSDLQKEVTLHGGTEQAFNNKYWDNKKEGIYVDVINGKALFSSTDKFDSGTGWPSFTKPIEGSIIDEKQDNSYGMSRTEVKSGSSGAHLGHVFDDGPKEHGGNRFCINSASLRFIPKEDLKKEGYEQYLYLFDGNKYEKAYLAGGCFWGMEELFANLDGITNVVNGYSGGKFENPTYEFVSAGITGHAETIAITFDPKKISYEEILRFFFKIHDPTTMNQQGNDIGSQYRSAIFYVDDKQKEIANKLIKKANESGVFPGKIVTKIDKFNKFYMAEEYHQDYLKNNPGGYTCHRIRNNWEF